MTGSQQFHLMKNISETLAGRVAILELMPFSLNETKTKSLKNIIWTGLFPEPACHPSKRDLWIKSYIQTYIERDIRQLENIRDFRAFEIFINLSAAIHSQEFHCSSLAREAGVSQPTIKTWAKILEASYMSIMLPPFYKNFGKRIIKTPKFYFSDPSLVCYLTRQPSAQAAISGNMAGALFEGLVICEVWKTFSNMAKKPSAFFWRSQSGLEVDLIIQARDKLWPIEIKLTSTPSPTHIKPLQEFKTLAGKEAAQKGILVCRTSKKTALPENNIALPWTEFSDWLKDLIS